MKTQKFNQSHCSDRSPKSSWDIPLQKVKCSHPFPMCPLTSPIPLRLYPREQLALAALVIVPVCLDSVGSVLTYATVRAEFCFCEV